MKERNGSNILRRMGFEYLFAKLQNLLGKSTSVVEESDPQVVKEKLDRMSEKNSDVNEDN